MTVKVQVMREMVPLMVVSRFEGESVERKWDYQVA